jgi:3-hydroxyisobutyrate dehydrogenase-like beta-hydroxyacid dehydrogenase
MLELKEGPMRSGDFEPLFRLAHMLKDLRHTLEEAERLGARVDLGRGVERLYAEAQAAGLGDADFAAVYRVVDREDGVPKAG